MPSVGARDDHGDDGDDHKMIKCERASRPLMSLVINDNVDYCDTTKFYPLCNDQKPL